MVFCPFHRGHREICTRNRPVSETKFLDDFFRPLSLPAPLVFDTKYDRAKVPPYNGNDPPPAPRTLKALQLPPLLNKVQNKGTQGVQARYGAELPPLNSPLSSTPRPVILGMEVCFSQNCAPLLIRCRKRAECCFESTVSEERAH